MRSRETGTPSETAGGIRALTPSLPPGEGRGGGRSPVSRLPSPVSAAGRSAFTLVEMMVVIIIVGILAGLLTVAISRAGRTPRQAAIKAEISQLDMALQRYQTDNGGYPPCMGYYRMPMVTPATYRSDRFEAHVRRVFPRYSETYTNMKNNFDTTYGVDLDELDQAEALVFWIGGPPSAGGSTKLAGFSADPTNPFNPNGPRKPALFEFDETRLTDYDGDGWPEYIPNGKPPAGPMPPYVYFDPSAYVDFSFPANQKPRVIPAPYPTKAFPESFSMTTPASQIAQWGTIVPCAEVVTGDIQSDTNNFAIQYVNPKKPQIVAAGLDGVYSLEGFDGYSGKGNWPQYPSGNGYAEGTNDNITNFTDGTTMEDDIPN